ncbi:MULTISPECIES: ABC transporter permease [Pseudomonadaceae]|jgi:simple sugar transport system permease protein|uniref:ABC transporter permease n=2 Tax=Pseudomonadaceae TaxID=135621 RepID=A0A178LF25_9PSED|nr:MULTISPECIES: ABC transporter permease [Pseudomonas]EHK68766.1 ABC transporter permease [Pseudomonas psychrotolerans L19]ELV1376222.1 ABC transporter permease [Pseudomonas aeruginosa]MBA1182936.1 ABC transporter permease [Pseudomonas psychrotolerans]MBA1214244.1 ABC transporter permease [Pseudomonas psychrotolerans]MDC7832004.1 ABC transporter permease [Pseudomonas benzopyrenica]
MANLDWLTFFLALLAGAVRVGTPFLFVSLGECLTEKGGRINLGLEGILVAGAMTGYAASYLSGSPWLGVLAAGCTGLLLGLLHGIVCSLPKVNDIAFGIALILLGTGLAFFLGKAFIQPQAPMLPSFSLGHWSADERVRSALNINVLFFLGVALAILLHWGLRSTRWGLMLRLVGDHAESAQALGYHPIRVRIWATSVGGFLAGVGGAYLSLYYPGSWNEGLSSGQGLMAVALVIFARWQPLNCLWASLLFGAAGAIGPALQAVGISTGYYLFAAAPYALTLLVMFVTCRPNRTLTGAPGELSLTR